MRAHSYDAFFLAPFERGRFWWTEIGVTMLLQWGDKRGEHLMVYTSHAQNNWAAPGEVMGWDGNLDAPTFSPSIGVLHGDGSSGYQWHGFLEGGTLRDA